jgi:hypothetical protein
LRRHPGGHPRLVQCIQVAFLECRGRHNL